jgi:hypothetical protein
MNGHLEYKYTEEDFDPKYKHLIKGTNIVAGSNVSEAEHSDNK